MDAPVPRVPTVIAYQWRRPRYSNLVFPLVFLLGGLFLSSLFHATHLRCSRESDRCSLDAHGAWVSTRHVEVPASDVTEMRVDVIKGKNPHARASLITKSGSIDLSGGPFLVRFSPDSARRVQREVERFLARETASVDVWIDMGLLHLFVGMLAGMLFYAAAIMVRHDGFELFLVRIVVDHERGVLEVAGKEVRLADISDIRLETEELPEWSSTAKNKIGGRIVIETTSGEVLHATKKVPAGHMSEHERALERLRTAAGFLEKSA